ncbi:MAG: methylamine dehydrogenase [Novosphingobium sp. 17-62-19]|uniref:amine dehydrogenase large subunit n=1 Tax=Novosphingobium sp. 17-62-19 TaxID=1970406 RepID=UPI000BD0582B|nr:amine dehydrogenase large subunit [Novosphingobium sp. 17-62-19]OZA21268.1 MAG: methylamine dehydrogenase [Novosphingobium sp. 17-62-19]HQS98558.1 amine dehydrogenase large subunit [Novosphingobium sp.]
MKRMGRLARVAIGAVTMGAMGMGAFGAPVVAENIVPEAEEATVNTIDPPKLGWFYVRGGWGSAGSSIFDAGTGKMLGMVSTSRDSDLAIDPAGKFYYVAETMWTKVNRGTRMDFISIYDSKTLKLVTEIPTPGRLIVGGFTTNFVLSDDGKTAYDYNFDPASSVNVIDMAKRKFVRAIELPGCASLIPNEGVGFSALCADGTLATVAVKGATQEITRSAEFFDAAADPIYSNVVFDRKKNMAVLLSYTGLVRTVAMGAAPVVSAPFSIQEAGGMRAADVKPLDIAWYPGGMQPTALHRPSGTLWVLMHKGEYWSHKEGAEEIWGLDLATKKLVKRIPVRGHPRNIEITQDDAAMIMVNGMDNNAMIIDSKTGEVKHEIENAGGGLITVVEPK